MERVTYKEGEICEVFIADSETWFVCKVQEVFEGECAVTILPFEDTYGPNNGWHWCPRAENMRKLRPRKANELGR
jgi:hypothetical protein